MYHTVWSKQRRGQYRQRRVLGALHPQFALQTRLPLLRYISPISTHPLRLRAKAYVPEPIITAAKLALRLCFTKPYYAKGRKAVKTGRGILIRNVLFANFFSPNGTRGGLLPA